MAEGGDHRNGGQGYYNKTIKQEIQRGMKEMGDERLHEMRTAEGAKGQLSERDENERRIILIGKTGCGKSALGNTILGKKVFESKTSLSSVTSKCKMHQAERFGKDVLVIDTPGFFDNNMTAEDLTNEIVKCIGIASPGPHAIVLVLRLGRITKEDQDTFELFEELFGDAMNKHVIIAFTGRDDLDRDNETIENQVQGGHNQLTKILEKCNKRYLAFDNTPSLPSMKRDDDAEKLIREVGNITIANNGQYYSNEMFKEAEKKLHRRMKQLAIERMQSMQTASEIMDIGEYLKDIRSMLRKEIEKEDDKLVLKNLSSGLYRISLGLLNAGLAPFRFVGSRVFKQKQ